MSAISVWPALLLSFAVPYGLVLVVPGPNLLLVLRSTLVPSRVAPLLAAGGIACGAMLAAAVGPAFASALRPRHAASDISLHDDPRRARGLTAAGGTSRPPAASYLMAVR
jgi:hypothetical protein